LQKEDSSDAGAPESPRETRGDSPLALPCSEQLDPKLRNE